MTTTRDDLHARIDQLSDDRLEVVAALLDLAEQRLLDAKMAPPGLGGTWGELVDFLHAHHAVLDADYSRALEAAHEAVNTPVPLADDPWER